MSTRASVGFVLLCAASAGCAAAPASRPSAAPPSAPTPKAAAPARPLSAALASVAPNADYVVRINGRALRKSPLFASLLRDVPSSSRLTAINKKCGFAVLDAINEIVLSGRLVPGLRHPDLQFPLVAVELNRAPEDGMRCVARVAGDARRATVAHHAALQTDVDEYVAVSGRLVLAGSRRALANGIARVERGGDALPGPLERALAAHLNAGLYARATLSHALHAPAKSAELLLQSDPSRFLLRVSVEAESSRAAARLTTRAGVLSAGLRLAARAAKNPQIASDLRALARALQTQARGRTATLEFAVSGDLQTQASRVELATYLLVDGIRRHLAHTKSIAARALVHIVTQRLVSYLKTLPAARRRMPPSAPRTPSQVPRGKPVTITRRDWRGTWKLLHFTPSGHPLYSLEIRVSRDRKHAAVRALGDLDGDGVVATYEQAVDIAPGGAIRVAPALKITHEGD